MLTLIFFACIIFIAAIASVYQDKLLLKGFVTVHNSLLSKLIPGRMPITGGKNPLDNRRRFTIIGIVLYSVSVLCIAFCVYTALTLEPVEGLEYLSSGGRGSGVIVWNSTEYLVSWITSGWMLFEGAIYLINSIRVIISRPLLISGKIVLGLIIVLLILLCLGLAALCWYAAEDTWHDIQVARG